MRRTRDLAIFVTMTTTDCFTFAHARWGNDAKICMLLVVLNYVKFMCQQGQLMAVFASTHSESHGRSVEIP